MVKVVELLIPRSGKSGWVCITISWESVLSVNGTPVKMWLCRATVGEGLSCWGGLVWENATDAGVSRE